MGERIPLARALRVAEAVVDALTPGCDRIEIAGSIRRKRADVKDIELVCVPKLRRNLLGEWTEETGDELRPIVQRLMGAARAIAERMLVALVESAAGSWSLSSGGAVWVERGTEARLNG